MTATLDRIEDELRATLCWHCSDELEAGHVPAAAAPPGWRAHPDCERAQRGG
jgi:hypothetical protein